VWALKKVAMRSMAAADSCSPAEIKYRENVDSMPPGFEGNVDICGDGSISDAGGVVIEDFVLADLDEHRGKAVHVGEDRRAPRVARVGAGKVLGYREFEHFTSYQGVRATW
jgi:hypothetical protein